MAVIHTSLKKASVFDITCHFYITVIFVGKAWSLPLEGIRVRRSTQYDPTLYRLEVTNVDYNTAILINVVKWFIVQTLGGNLTVLFSLSLTREPNKLVCFSAEICFRDSLFLRVIRSYVFEGKKLVVLNTQVRIEF
jgi:hypothetical protein